MRGVRLAGFGVAHHLGIAVVGGDDERAADFLERRGDAAEAGVDGLDRRLRGLEVAGVSDHVGIRIIEHDQVELAGFDGVDDLVGDLVRRHLRLLVIGRDLGRWHQDALLAVETPSRARR